MNNLLERSKVFLNKNASTILTVTGAVGVVATTYSAVKATPKAIKLLEKAKEEKGENLTEMEVVKTVAPVYIPSVLIGVSTIACIFGVNALSKRQQAAVMSAYALIDNSYKEYKKKVEELYGEESGAKIREEIAKDHYEEDDIPEEVDDKTLFYDYFSGRYFTSTIEDVQRAEYRINRNLHTMCGVTVNDFYEYLGIDPIDSGDQFGWSLDGNWECYWQSWIDFTHEKVTLDDGLECQIIYMQQEPIIGFDDY